VITHELHDTGRVHVAQKKTCANIILVFAP